MPIPKQIAQRPGSSGTSAHRELAAQAHEAAVMIAPASRLGSN